VFTKSTLKSKPVALTPDCAATFSGTARGSKNNKLKEQMLALK